MKKNILRSVMVLIVASSLFVPDSVMSWGFWAHKQINRNAISLLPAEMQPFFKQNEAWIVTHAVDPDNRRRVDPNEGARHYIDIDRYGKYPFSDLPHQYEEAVKKYSDSTVKQNGTVVWRIADYTKKLTQAMREQNRSDILYFAANLGHYVADCHVPLHATENYDGQLTGQQGIHARWESDYPERFMTSYEPVRLADLRGNSLAVYYIKSPLDDSFAWALESYVMIAAVLKADSIAKAATPDSLFTEKKFPNGRSQKIYPDAYYKKFKEQLNGTVEPRFEQAVQRVASLWYTAWVDAGKPALPLTETPIEQNLENISK
jgi:hypothetical protein